MEMQFKNEINKLADIVVWADNGIEEMRMDLSSLTEEKFKNLDAVKDLEAVKKVVLESIERHAAYTSALNKDLADKAAKIELLEKEIEGRKEGYYALKDKMTDLEETLEIRTKENRSLIKANEKLEKESEKWQDLAKMNRDTICDQYGVCEDFKKRIVKLEEENEKLKVDLIHEREKNEKLAKDHSELENDVQKSYTDIISHSKTIYNLKKELEQTCTTKELDLKGHNRREMALVNELADKNDEIKKLEESIDYYKNQERIRTDQLRATESKVEELHGSINRLTLNCRAKNTEIARLTKEHSDIRHELAKRTAELEFNGEDDHGRAGFKRYIEYLIEEEERAVPERFKERLNKEITEIFTKEEETEVEVDKSKNYGPIPESVRSARRAAKVNDIPCGEDSIE